MNDTGEEADHLPPIWDYPPLRIVRPPELDLAINPHGHDPRERTPWTSTPVYDIENQGSPLTKAHSMVQFFEDADEHVIFTTDGRPVHYLTDENGQKILGDDDGQPILVALERPENALNWPEAP